MEQTNKYKRMFKLNFQILNPHSKCDLQIAIAKFEPELSSICRSCSKLAKFIPYNSEKSVPDNGTKFNMFAKIPYSSLKILPNNQRMLEHIEYGIEHLATLKHPPELKNYTVHR